MVKSAAAIFPRFYDEATVPSAVRYVAEVDPALVIVGAVVAGDVLPHLNKQSRESADTFRAVNEGSHDALPGPVIDLVKSAEKLARWLVTLS